MKKRTKGIIAGSCVVLALGGTLAALMLTAPEPEADEEETAVTEKKETSSLLYDSNPSDIAKIEITNDSGGYVIERYADGFWTLPSISGLPLSYDDVNGVVDTLASLVAEETVNEAPDDLSIYGLDSPQLTAEISFDGGKFSEKKLVLGNETPKGNCYYFMLDGGGTVYTVKKNTVSALFDKEYDFINHVLYENVTDDDNTDDYDPSKINSIRIKRPDIDYDIVLSYDKRQDEEDAITGNMSTHVLTDPVSLDLNPDKCEAVLHGIMGLTASDVAAVDPDEAALKEYGFDEPMCTVDFDINAGPATVTIGNKYYNEENIHTGYYAMRDGVDVVYVLRRESVPWVNVMPLDITSTLVIGIYIYSVDSLEVEYDGNTDLFEIGGGQDNFSAKLNGAEMADSDLFKSFYQFVLRAPAEELYLEEDTDEPRITLKINSEFGQDVLEFVPSSDRKTIIRLNGRTSFRCRTPYVDRLIENLGRLKNGEEMITSW